MSEAFIPVPPGALAVVGREGRLAVLDLYERAFAARWAPLPFTERELGETWGVGRKVAMRIVEGLIGGGFVELQPGAGRRPSVLIVRNVTSHGTKTGPDTGPKPPRKKAVNTSPRNQTRDQSGTTHARVVDAEEKEEEEEIPLTPKGGGPPDEQSTVRALLEAGADASARAATTAWHERQRAHLEHAADVEAQVQAIRDCDLPLTDETERILEARAAACPPHPAGTAEQAASFARHDFWERAGDRDGALIEQVLAALKSKGFKARRSLASDLLLAVYLEKKR